MSSIPSGARKRPVDQMLTNLESKPSETLMMLRNQGHGLDEALDSGRALSGNHDMLYEVDVLVPTILKNSLEYSRPPERASL